MCNKYRLVFILASVWVPWDAHAQHAAGSMIEPDTYRGLTADRRAHQVGDTLTVVVTETTQASASANTDADSAVQLAGNLQNKHGQYNYALGLSGADAGEGKTTRAGSLQAQLTVRVIAMEGGEMLRIRGEQTVVVNGEKQHFALTGLVRGEDISASNVILSNRISDANIEFTGQGDVSEAQRRSILYRISRWLHLI